MRRAHLFDKVFTWGSRHHPPVEQRQKAMCGAYGALGVDWITDDPGLVTCLLCIARVEKAEAGVTEESVRGQARQRAHPRAVRRLIELHADEFGELLDQEMKTAIPVEIERERSFREYMARHGDDYD